MSGLIVKRNDIGKAAEAIVKEGAKVVAETANSLESELRQRRWSSRIPVKIRKKGPLLVEVVVGGRRGFYAGFLEFGTRFQAPKPVVTPAAERASREFRRKAENIERAIRNL